MPGNGGTVRAIRNSNGRGDLFIFSPSKRRSLTGVFAGRPSRSGDRFDALKFCSSIFPFFSLPLSLFSFSFYPFFFSEREPIFSRVFSTTVPVEFLTVFPLSAEFSTGGACYRWGSR